MDAKAVLTGRRCSCNPRRTVLVVDNEPMIRQLAEMVLAGPELRVLLTANPVTARERFAEHADMIDLIVLDLMAPRVSTQELERQLWELAPEVRILITTDRPDEILPVGLNIAGILLKPYLASELARAVRSALDGISVQRGTNGRS